MKKKILFTLSVLAAGFVCFCIWMVSGIGSDAYYTQIDNTQLEEVIIGYASKNHRLRK
mgnify:CR=1 FL=1